MKIDDRNHFRAFEVIQIITKYFGIDLLNKRYHPVFDYYEKDFLNAFRIVNDEYVSEGNGTGIVHIAPAFGEDDFRIGMRENIISKTVKPPCPLDDNGNFIDKITEYSGLYFKDANPKVIQKLKLDNNKSDIFLDFELDFDNPVIGNQTN